MKTNKFKWIFCVFLSVTMACCTGKKITLPVETSVGSLVSVEQKDNVLTAGEEIAIKPEEVLYLLTFKGKSEFTLQGARDKTDPKRAVVDTEGKEYWPVYYGCMGEDGSISNEGWMVSGQMTGGENGQLVFQNGSMKIPKPEFTLVYCVPRDIDELALRDGDKQYPVK